MLTENGGAGDYDHIPGTSEEGVQLEENTAETSSAGTSAVETFGDGEIGSNTAAAGEKTKGSFCDSITGIFSGDKSYSTSEGIAGEAEGAWTADEMIPEEWVGDDEVVDGDLEDGDVYVIGDEPYAETNAVAGTLTGGEIRDLKNWDNWLRTLSSDALAQWNMVLDQRTVVYVHDDEGPLNNIDVRLMQEDTLLYEAVTDVTGYAYLFARYRSDDMEQEPTQVQVKMQDGTWTSYAYSANYAQVMDIAVEQQASDVQVDLMFVVDTTGSMGDELEYLKVELQDVIERVEEETGTSIRTSVNFYRDEGDEYVVRYYDFRDDASEVATLVGEQEADGGGDAPEAVHTALYNALNEHNWSEDSTVKLLFLVLDAPPHEEYATEILDLTVEAAAMGVRIIPVAASGASEDTQQLLRGMAVMTGGTFIFLDDNSGVGYGHTVTVKPEEYSSEYLNAMMIRIIGEYCGVNIDVAEVEKPTEEETTAFSQ